MFVVIKQEPKLGSFFLTENDPFSNESRVTWDAQQKHFFCQILNDRIYPEIGELKPQKNSKSLGW